MSKKIALILEDDLNRIEEFKKRFSEVQVDLYAVDFVDKSEEAIECLQKNDYLFVTLDHDLGGEIFVDTEREDTGSEVARWISESEWRKENSIHVFIHSFNPDGAKNMQNLIKGSVLAPGIWTKEMFHSIFKNFS